MIAPFVQWSQPIVIFLAIALGAIYTSRSINHLDTRINHLIRNQDLRHNDLKDFIKSEVRRLDDRIARLEQPIIRS